MSVNSGCKYADGEESEMKKEDDDLTQTSNATVNYFLKHKLQLSEQLLQSHDLSKSVGRS